MANDMAVVFGANGGTGRRVVQALRRHGFSVRAVVRDEAKADGVAADGVEVFVGDVTKEDDVRRALQGATAVISALGSKGPAESVHIELIEYTAVAELAQLAKEAGVHHFVMCSSMGTEIPDMIPPLAEILRQKRRGELAVEEERCAIHHHSAGWA